MYDMQTREQFLNLHVGLGLDFGFVCLFTFKIFYVFHFSLRPFIHVLLAIIVLNLVSSVPSREIGWEEHVQNDLFCVEWDVKP